MWIAASANAVAALALSLLGRQQPVPRGWRLWQLALWLSTAGIALAAAVGLRAMLLPLSQLLMLQ